MTERDLAMKTNITIRPATRADLAAIVRLLADDPLGRERESAQEPLLQAYEDTFAAITGDAANELVVVEAGGEMIGTLQLTIIPSLTYQGGRRAQIEACVWLRAIAAVASESDCLPGRSRGRGNAAAISYN